MLPINGSSDIKSSIIPYDYSSLSSFYSTGAYLGTAKHADKLENGALKDILSIDTSAPVPPWKIRQVTEGEIIDRVFSGSPLIDEDDPLFDRDDVDDNFKNLFALYKGLLRMEELTEYAKTSEGNDFATLLQRQYDIHVKEIEDFLEDALFTDLYVVPGLKTDKLRSTITIPPSTSDNAYVGNTVTTDTSTVISSLSASDSLTITVTKDYVDTDVVVNLSDAASLSLADIATQINSDLTTAGFSSTFSTKRFAGPSDTADSHYALQVDFASGEALSLAAGAAAESSAVYVAGRTGSGDLANGFLAKIDDLASADPSQIFYESIDSEYDTDFHMDSANGVAVDSKGNVYTVGTTNGNMEGQINVDGADVFLRKYDASGQLLFSRMLGSNESGGGFKVAVDSSDNVVISGQTGGALTQSAYDGGLDNFISKFGSEGEELWTRQLGPFATDSALDVTFDSSGNIYASGITYGAISSDQTYGEDADAYVTKLDSSGTLQFNRQYSAGGSEKATAVAVNSSGDIFIAGMADANGFLRKYDSSGNVTYTQSLGSVGTSGDVTGISLDSNGDAYVSGFTTDTALDSTVINAHSGDTDGFVLHVDDQGASAAINWVTYVGTTSTDKNFGVVADTSDNSFYVTGSTSGTLSGETSSASTDAFMAKFTSAGALSYTHQFGGGQTIRVSTSPSMPTVPAHCPSSACRAGRFPSKIRSPSARAQRPAPTRRSTSPSTARNRRSPLNLTTPLATWRSRLTPSSASRAGRRWNRKSTSVYSRSKP